MNAQPKVLIVEDEVLIAFDLSNRLSRLGFTPTDSVRSAAEAFESIERERPDIVLMDIRIDGQMDGVDAAAIIRERYSLPVVFLTSHTDEVTLERAQATEPFGYIIKPFQSNNLKATITLALRKYRLETELQESKRELYAAKESAEAANRAKSDFLARMSHEIRTPMNLINGMNTLLRESALTEKQREHVETSFRNVRRLLRLINGILDLSKVEAGELTFDLRPFDLNELLKESQATIAAAVERKGLELEVVLDPGAWRYWVGDAERLQQVLLNLIGNSIKFTPQGKIGVRVFAEVGAAGEKGLRFEVTDSGCGIPPDQANRIFEPFHQVEGAKNRRYEGSGLGLAIARSLVERMGGKIWLGQNPECGSKFLFTAFLESTTEWAVQNVAARSETKDRSTAVLAGTKVLIAEDNAENVILIQAYLDGLPITLDFAANGVEAVEKRRRGDYDLLLMDVQMPVMDGYQATTEIRRWEKAQAAYRIPIVALTAHAINGAVAESLQAGCDGHLTKPFERDDLVAVLSNFAGRPRGGENEIPESIRLRQPAFLANRRGDVETMRVALMSKDLKTIQRIGHNCKGTGGGYGFPKISEIGAAIEEAAKANDEVRAQKFVSELEQVILAAV